MGILGQLFERQNYYLMLDESKNVIPAKNWEEYADNARANKRVLHTKFENEDYISTIFLGSNHRYNSILERPSKDNPPLVFETMIFSDLGDGTLRSRIIQETHYGEYQTRCSTYLEALHMHAEALLLYFIDERMPQPPKETLRQQWKNIKENYLNAANDLEESFEDPIFD